MYIYTHIFSNTLFRSIKLLNTFGKNQNINLVLVGLLFYELF